MSLGLGFSDLYLTMRVVCDTTSASHGMVVTAGNHPVKKKKFFFWRGVKVHCFIVRIVFMLVGMILIFNHHMLLKIVFINLLLPLMCVFAL